MFDIRKDVQNHKQNGEKNNVTIYVYICMYIATYHELESKQAIHSHIMWSDFLGGNCTEDWLVQCVSHHLGCIHFMIFLSTNRPQLRPF